MAPFFCCTPFGCGGSRRPAVVELSALRGAHGTVNAAQIAPVIGRQHQRHVAWQTPLVETQGRGPAYTARLFSHDLPEDPPPPYVPIAMRPVRRRVPLMAPQTISHELETFLQVERGTRVSRIEVAQALSVYVHLPPGERRPGRLGRGNRHSPRR